MLLPVKGNCVGVAPTGDPEALTGLVTGGGTLVADTEPNPIGGVVVVDVGDGAGALVAGASGGTAVGEVTGAQSSMVCWNPLFATHGGPT